MEIRTETNGLGVFDPLTENSLPEWDITSEYASIQSDELNADLNTVFQTSREITETSERLHFLLNQTEWNDADRADLVSGLTQSYLQYAAATELISNCITYASCLSATDMTNEAAHKLTSSCLRLQVDLGLAYQPQALFIIRAPGDIYRDFVGVPAIAPSRFYWDQRRRGERDLLLSAKEESLISSLSISGFTSWSNLYEKLTGTMRVELKDAQGLIEIVGLAQAQALVKQGDATRRRAAWRGIQKAWRVHQEAAAAVINGLAGWRLEMVKRRSHIRATDFLEEPLMAARIEKETLDAMMATVFANAEPIREAIKGMGALHKKVENNAADCKMDPWDLVAPAPALATQGAAVSFDVGLQMIIDAFGEAAPEFADFVKMARDRRWIEARVLPNKRGGAHCTEFAKSKTPRVFQTFMGSYGDVSTLAHELGHAYHSWVIRDLPFPQQSYPMTLAETASIFAESVLSDYLSGQAASREAKLAIAYAEVESAASILINVSSRFDFEKSVYEQRSHGPLSPADLSELNDRAWKKWYGGSLSEMDTMFWANKMHFYFSDVSFYNFPYIFGYLFSLNLYSRRQELGKQFMPKYIALLRDTGRMTAEDLIKTHLGEDIRTPEFWQKSLDLVTAKCRYFRSSQSSSSKA
jgi:oligoendopeptidase F